jgi:BarA-like signal transduction histidine kinase
VSVHEKHEIHENKSKGSQAIPTHLMVKAPRMSFVRACALKRYGAQACNFVYFVDNRLLCRPVQQLRLIPLHQLTVVGLEPRRRPLFR